MEEPVRALVAFGTRPEAVKMAPVVRALGADPAFDVRVLSTAQHREMLDQVTRLFGLREDYDLDAMRGRQALPGLTARILEGASDVLGGAPPDVVLVHGDTTTTFAVALAAFYAQVPVGHVEAGLRSHRRWEPFPEEMNRRLVSTIATWHYAPTERNRANLVAEGAEACDVWVTGNTVIDALLSVVSPAYRFHAPELGRVDIAGRRVIGLTCHRRENLEAPLARMLAAVRDDVEVVFPVHRNPAVREVAERELGRAPRVHLVEPLDYGDFSNLMARCSLMLTDSGGVQEEAPALDVPVIVLRDVTERPEAVEAGCALLAGTTYEGVRRSLGALLDDAALYARMAAAPDPYGDGHAAERIRAALREAFGRA
ncbi:non-hydrolyzing UDP-N-acetylglucosamine 2-epimerase [Gordonibacter urolithinfaciens]|uniref:non-hydrolyzing UDP-N-acetylglucosamine 2-epimerase n=1 Tax=Gordonibacter urolithinfaciens TaxID=1335613 RepID=UPI003A905C13